MIKVGVAKVDGTLPIGVPLAGYNHGDRRVPLWPVPEFTNYTTFMMPSKGVMDPTWVKVLIVDDGTNPWAIITLDGIGSDSSLNYLSWTIAATKGFTIPFENCIFSSSHSHSGPGAVSPEMLWALAPATDFMVPEVQTMLAESTAKAMLQAQNSLQPGQIGIATGLLTGVTVNRRADISPVLQEDSIDPNLGLIRIDDMNGKTLATVWNYAIHGVCYGPENMYFSGDIMGKVCEHIENDIGGVALFVNADAGDIDPGYDTCDNAPDFNGASKIASAVEQLRSKVPTYYNDIKFQVHSEYIDFGPTELNATLGRFENCTHGGPLDICTFCNFMHCDLNLHMPSSWIETKPRFTAVSTVLGGEKVVIVTLPGEPLLELGWWVRNDTLDLGYDVTLLAGYSNNHMGYFCTPDEYDLGGYESQLTLWGINTANMVRDGCKKVAEAVVPK